MKNFLIVFVLGCALVLVGCQEDLSEEVKVLSQEQVRTPDTHKAAPPKNDYCIGRWLVSGLIPGAYIRVVGGPFGAYNVGNGETAQVVALDSQTTFWLENATTNTNVSVAWCFCDEGGLTTFTATGQSESFTATDTGNPPNCAF